MSDTRANSYLASYLASMHPNMRSKCTGKYRSNFVHYTDRRTRVSHTIHTIRMLRAHANCDKNHDKVITISVNNHTLSHNPILRKQNLIGSAGKTHGINDPYWCGWSTHLFLLWQVLHWGIMHHQNQQSDTSVLSVGGKVLRKSCIGNVLHMRNRQWSILVIDAGNIVQLVRSICTHGHA